MMKKNVEHEQSDARDIALKALDTFRRNKTWPEYMLKTYFQKFKVNKKDSALAWRIVFGVIQNYLLLEYYVMKHSTIPLKKIHPTVMDILKLSAYQIIYLSRIPDSAAVNEGVRLTKKYSNQQAAGFVNAVLRKISKASENNRLPEIESETLLQKLSIEFSHSEWLVDEFVKAFGIDDTIRLLELNNKVQTCIFAQVNILHSSVDEVMGSFTNKKIGVKKHEWLDDCVCLTRVGDITAQNAFIEGKIYVQDPASRLAVIASGVKSGDVVVDACSAPGGKAYTAALMMKNKGLIHAIDKKRDKVSEIKNGALRLGINIIKAQANDSTKAALSLIGKADVVLADVPCSGFGTIRKHPEIRLKSQKSIDKLQAIQRDILSAVSQYVKPGGVLLYSTCSILKQENEDVVKDFLADNSDFAPQGFVLPKIGNVQCGMITLLPHVHETDGFFICRLKRVES